MQREILFRGMRTDGKGWAYGYYFFNELTGKHYIISVTYSQSINEEVISETVGQYTGLTDKHKKKIFEGDKFSFCTDRNGVHKRILSTVFYIEAEFVISETMPYDTYLSAFASNGEVISNIHESPPTQLRKLTD